MTVRVPGEPDGTGDTGGVLTVLFASGVTWRLAMTRVASSRTFTDLNVGMRVTAISEDDEWSITNSQVAAMRWEASP